MYIGMNFFLGLAGIITAGLLGLIATPVPYMFRVILFIFGALLWLMSVVMLYNRLDRLGLMALVRPAGPNEVIWFYVRNDGSMIVTPALRKYSLSEGMLFNPETDGWAADLKAYHLADKQVRFVVEDVGKAVDLNYCAYATMLKKTGFENMKDLLFWWRNPEVQQEYMKQMEGEQNE